MNRKTMVRAALAAQGVSGEELDAWTDEFVAAGMPVTEAIFAARDRMRLFTMQVASDDIRTFLEQVRTATESLNALPATPRRARALTELRDELSMTVTRIVTRYARDLNET